MRDFTPKRHIILCSFLHLLLIILQLLAKSIDLAVGVVLGLQFLIEDHNSGLKPIILNFELAGIAALSQLKVRSLVCVHTLARCLTPHVVHLLLVVAHLARLSITKLLLAIGRHHGLHALEAKLGILVLVQDVWTLRSFQLHL